MRTLLCTILALFSLTAVAQQRTLSPLGETIQAAMQSDIRTPAETARDRNRRPIETLEFLGLEDDMTVVELMPGGGWYTKILGQVLRDDGKLYLAVGAGRAAGLAEEFDVLDKVELLDVDAPFKPTDSRAIFGLDPFSLGVENADMVLTFRNMHNFNEAGRNAMSKAAFDALKPGGIYGVVDHTRRHMEPMNPENFRRIDPVLVIKELLDLGFEFEGYSPLHRKPDDELLYEVGRKSVTGNTDRFTLKFRKPN
jgi:predicted methyltransferase